jgi:hypothetical protein
MNEFHASGLNLDENVSAGQGGREEEMIGQDRGPGNSSTSHTAGSRYFAQREQSPESSSDYEVVTKSENQSLEE